MNNNSENDSNTSDFFLPKKSKKGSKKTKRTKYSDSYSDSSEALTNFSLSDLDEPIELKSINKKYSLNLNKINKNDDFFNLIKLHKKSKNQTHKRSPKLNKN